jgi:endonuclease G, mitochondrial
MQLTTSCTGIDPMKNVMKTIRTTLVTVVLVGLVSGCAHQINVSRPAIYSAATFQPQAGPSPTDAVLIQKHCPFGTPKLSSKVNFGPVQVITHEGYVLLHCQADKIPLWVCEYLPASQLTGPAVRENKFFPEPKLKPGQRAELADYARSGYDRGHQAPAADFKSNQRLIDDTFSLANMAPQWPNLNRKNWSHLEDKVRDWISSRGAGYVITGPMFYSPAEEKSETATGIVKHPVIGINAVAVPTHFYKIVVAKNSDGVWEAIAFVLPNVKKTQPENFASNVVSIDWVETRTGLNFMPDLDTAAEERLERNTPAMWR